MSKQKGPTTDSLQTRLTRLEKKLSKNPANTVAGAGNSTVKNIRAYEKRIKEESKKEDRHYKEIANLLAKHGVALCGRDEHFLKFIANPLRVDPLYKNEFIRWPFTDGDIPCHSVDVVRWDVINLVANASGNIEIHFWPEGYVGSSGDGKTARRFSIGGSTWILGPQSTDTAVSPCYGWYRDGNTTTAPVAEPAFWTSSATLANTGPLVWGNETTSPKTFSGAVDHGSQEYRCTGFGAVLSDIGDLETAKGYMYRAQTYDYPASGVSVAYARSEGQTTTASAAYSEVYCNQRRTLEMSWRPSCDGAKMSYNDASNTVLTSEVPCKMVMGVNGVANSRAFRLQVFALYELVFPNLMSMNTPGHLSSHKIDLKNAIAQGFESKDYKTRALESKSENHPVLSKLSDVAVRASRSLLPVLEKSVPGIDLLAETMALAKKAMN